MTSPDPVRAGGGPSEAAVEARAICQHGMIVRETSVGWLHHGGSLCVDCVPERVVPVEVAGTVPAATLTDEQVEAAAAQLTKLFGYAIGWSSNNWEAVDEGVRGVVRRDTRSILLAALAGLPAAQEER
jgi:hypothetical protein